MDTDATSQGGGDGSSRVLGTPSSHRLRGMGARSLLLLLVVLLGCPEGLPDPVSACADGELLDGDACVPADCGLGPWGDVAPDPEGTTWYVLAGSSGDGTADAPFGAISSAMEAAAEVPGGRIVIGAGRYPERLSFSRAHDGLELHGRCTELVTLDGEGLAAATLSVFASQVVVRSITITGGRPGVIAGQVPGAPGLVLRGNDLVIATNGGYGVLATGSGVLLDLAESVIEDVRPTNELSPGRGLGVEQGARLIGVGLTVRDVAGVGVQVAQVDSDAEIDGLTVDAIIAQDDGSLGRDLHVEEGGTLVVRNAALGAPEEHAVVVEGGSSSLDLSDATVACGASWCGRAVGGGSLTAKRVAWTLTAGPGIQVHGAFSFADLGDSTLIGPSAGILTVEEGAALLAEGLVLDGAAGQAMHVAGFGTLADLTDIDIGRPGLGGLLVTDGAEVDADDVSVTEGGGPGLLAARDGELECTACQVDGAVFASVLAMSAGVVRLDGGSLRASVPHPERGGGVGILGIGDTSADTTLQADDTTITGHPHAGVAFRGGGTWRLAGAIVEASGGGGMAPGLLAADGTGYWQESAGPGLFVFGNTFRQLPNDALLFDAATGTLSGNSFEQIGQLQLYTQNCESVAPPQAAEQLVTNDCAGPARELGLTLSWPEPSGPPGL